MIVMMTRQRHAVDEETDLETRHSVLSLSLSLSLFLALPTHHVQDETLELLALLRRHVHDLPGLGRVARAVRKNWARVFFWGGGGAQVKTTGSPLR